ncbi:hypothetical protein MMC22_006326 [Lobaria immixta]|nr:hypothetical protein [Lobaria immixta]
MLSKPLRFVAFTNIGFLIFIVGQGILSLFKAQWEQRKVRNWILRTVMGRNDYSIPSDSKSKLRFFFAKSVAAAFYLTDVFATIVSPVVFISLVITNEFTARVYPVSKKSDAVGLWSPWVAVGSFKQCKRPFAHAGRSIEISRKRIQDEWDDFKDWWKNPNSVSNQSILIGSMRAAEIEKTADEQLRAFHGDVGEEGAKSDYERKSE